MLTSKPTEADEKSIANWEASNRMTFEIFFAFWQKASPDLEFPGTQAGEDASYSEWTDGAGDKCYGMRKPGGGQKHGIVRTIRPGNFIEESTYYEDKPHGLSFFWTDGN